MSKIAIVTDSTAYLSPEMIERYQVSVMPLKVHWRDETYLDGIDITPNQFYTRLARETVLPTTSQPSIYDVLTVLEKLATCCEGVIMPLISSGISGTVASAQAAIMEFSKVPVVVIDSHITSAGLALIVQATARAIEQGADLQKATEIARSVAARTHVIFMVDTLKYLHKGGRIGGASRYLGTALSIVPILGFDQEGKIDALDRVRTKRKAADRLLELVKERADGKPLRVGIIHANAVDKAAILEQRVADCFDCIEIKTFGLSPVIGTHVGPGTVGIAFHTD